MLRFPWDNNSSSFRMREADLNRFRNRCYNIRHQTKIQKHKNTKKKKRKKRRYNGSFWNNNSSCFRMRDQRFRNRYYNL